MALFGSEDQGGAHATTTFVAPPMSSVGYYYPRLHHDAGQHNDETVTDGDEDHCEDPRSPSIYCRSSF